jgi:hypothetical protein
MKKIKGLAIVFWKIELFAYGVGHDAEEGAEVAKVIYGGDYEKYRADGLIRVYYYDLTFGDGYKILQYIKHDNASALVKLLKSRPTEKHEGPNVPIRTFDKRDIISAGRACRAYSLVHVNKWTPLIEINEDNLKSGHKKWFNDTGLDQYKTVAIWATPDQDAAIHNMFPPEFKYESDGNLEERYGATWTDFVLAMKDPDKFAPPIDVGEAVPVVYDSDLGYLFIRAVASQEMRYRIDGMHGYTVFQG